MIGAKISTLLTAWGGEKLLYNHVQAVTCSACMFTCNVFRSDTPGIYCYGIIQINHIFPWSALQ